MTRPDLLRTWASDAIGPSTRITSGTSSRRSGSAARRRGVGPAAAGRAAGPAHEGLLVARHGGAHRATGHRGVQPTMGDAILRLYRAARQPVRRSSARASRGRRSDPASSSLATRDDAVGTVPSGARSRRPRGRASRSSRAATGGSRSRQRRRRAPPRCTSSGPRPDARRAGSRRSATGRAARRARPAPLRGPRFTGGARARSSHSRDLVRERGEVDRLRRELELQRDAAQLADDRERGRGGVDVRADRGVLDALARRRPRCSRGRTRRAPRRPRAGPAPRRRSPRSRAAGRRARPLAVAQRGQVGGDVREHALAPAQAAAPARSAPGRPWPPRSSGLRGCRTGG